MDIWKSYTDLIEIHEIHPGVMDSDPDLDMPPGCLGLGERTVLDCT